MNRRAEGLTYIALAAAFAVSLTACKKQEMPTPTTPDPKAAQTEVTHSDAGTTTTFAPPAEGPKAPAAN